MTQQDKLARPRARSIVAIVAAAGLLIVAALAVAVFHIGDPPASYYQQARQTRDAIIRGDYATARRITVSALAESRMQRWQFYPFEGFMGTIGGGADPAFVAHLAEWVAHDPSDPIALLISAQYKLNRAWSIRGTDWASRTETDRHVSFGDNLADALQDVDRSIQHDGGNPYAYYLELDILHGLGLHKDLIPQFQKAIARFPTYYWLYTTFLDTVDPRWGGSVEAMYAFVDQYAGRAPSGSPLKLLYLSLYSRLLDLASLTCADFPGDRDAKRQCVDIAMRRVVRPELDENLKTAFALYDTGDRYEAEAAIGATVYGIAVIPDGDIPAQRILQMAADAAQGDTALEPRNPGHNSYLIDAAVSRYWDQKGVADNALKKAKDALLDIENTRFPSAVEKNVAVAGIHELMAKIDSEHGRLGDMIEAEKAALALGVPTRHSQLVCLGYYGQKDYSRAIDACSQVIANEPGNLEARFWRGQAYFFSKQHDKAEIDLKVVAESSHPRRVAAAMSIAMTHISEQDYRGTVEAFDKYPYLFDLRLTDNADVASAYYNRCFANWQLGDLQRALSDCNESAKIDNNSGIQYMTGEIKRRMADASAKPTTVAH